MWAHTCRPAQMSHLDRQTTDWSWTKAGREKTKKERVVLVKVVKSFFYFFMKQQQLPTTWVRRSLRLDERLNILRIPPLLLFEKTWTVYSSVCAFWRITTVPITTTTTKRIKKTLKAEWSSVRINLLKEEEIKSLSNFLLHNLCFVQEG